MKKALVFSTARWAELRRAADPLTLEILQLMNRYGFLEIVDRVLEIDAHIWVPEAAKRPGAKPKWANGNVLYAWLEVEAELQLARRKNPKITPLKVMETKFRSLRNKPLRVLHDGRPNPQHLDIKDPKTACRLHSAGKKLLKENQQLAAKWQKILEHAIASEYRTLPANMEYLR
jgi:hypothetical protein